MVQRIYTLSFLAILFALPTQAQTPTQANVLANWQDNNITPTSWLDSRYNETWGVTINGLEIAIIGSTEGVHFMDITDPNNAVILEDAFVQGAATGDNLVHRDYHDYAGYLYAVADEGPSTLQIIDLSDLPNSTSKVYDSNELVRQAHNIFIDETSGHLYACGGHDANINPFNLRILSLQDPENPVVLGTYPNASLNIPYVHDVYVRHDTAYLNCGYSGLYVVDFNDPTNPVLLGTMTDYEQEGYNHSGWLHPNAPVYYLADETHGMDVKVVDVSDMSDIQVLSTFNAEAAAPTSIPHNIIATEQFLYISYYYDGLQVYDITDPYNPKRVFYYDTYDGADDDFFKGAWGVYPFPGSGNVVLSDMQTGLYLFEKFELTTTNSKEVYGKEVTMQLYPQPATSAVWLQFHAEVAEPIVLTITDLTGRQLVAPSAFDIQPGYNEIQLEVDQGLSNGLYLLSVKGEALYGTHKLMIQR